MNYSLDIYLKYFMLTVTLSFMVTHVLLQY